MNFGEYLQFIRNKYGITQKALGEELGITQQGVAKYESMIDPPKTSTVKKIASALSEISKHNVDYVSLLLPNGIRNTDDLVIAIEEERELNATLETLKELIKDAKNSGNSRELEKYQKKFQEILEKLSMLDGTKQLFESENIVGFEDPLEYEIAHLENGHPPHQSVLGKKARVIVAFDKLNADGQNAAVKRVEELTEIPKYQKEKE